MTTRWRRALVGCQRGGGRVFISEFYGGGTEDLKYFVIESYFTNGGERGCELGEPSRS